MSKRARTDTRIPDVDLDMRRFEGLPEGLAEVVRKVVSQITYYAKQASDNLRFHEVSGRVNPDDRAWYQLRLECDNFVISSSDVRRFQVFPEARQDEVFITARQAPGSIRLTITTSVRID